MGDRAFERGTFIDGDRDSMSTIVKYQDWDIDGAQNWSTMYNNSATAINSSLTEYNEVTSFNGGFSYDKNGNRVYASYHENDYKYDAYNRLVLVNLEYDGTSHNVSYAYDCDNRRKIKTVANGGPFEDSSLDGTTHYYYEGWRVIEEHDVIGGVESLQKQLVYGNYLDEVWVVDDRYTATVADLNDGSGDDRVFAHANTQYSVHGLTNETGDLIEAYEYDPYGKLTVIADSNDGDSIVNFSANDVRTVSGKSAFGLDNLYTGQRADHETGNYYYKNRYYDPEIGRFLTRDPIGHWGDSYNFGNGYAYVGNTSTRYNDPVGKQTVPYIRPNPHAPTPCFDCTKWATKEKEDSAWLKDLPDCPCTIGILSCKTANFGEPNETWICRKTYRVPDGWNGWADTRGSMDKYHPGARKCIRSKGKSEHGAGQQCCYDSKYNLITDGNGAGTPDKAHWTRVFSHLPIDVKPYEKCKEQGLLHLYYDVRPPNNGKNCKSNMKGGPLSSASTS